VYEIPVSKIQESLQQCYHSALNFWQGGKYAAEKGGLHIAVGLWILSLEEVGKHVLLQEAASQAGVDGVLRVRVRDFKNHVLKAEKGQALFKQWGIDLEQVGIPLTNKTRTGLWFVTWDENKSTFRREFERLDPYPISKAGALEELVMLGLNRVQKMQQASPVVT